MIGFVKGLAKRSRTGTFNLVNRDAWVARLAAGVPRGARDVPTTPVVIKKVTITRGAGAAAKKK